MPMRVAASGLRSDAGRLESAADQLASTASQARDAWTSDSADLATGHIGDLHTWYLGHAEHVRGLAGDLDAHADQFDQVRAAVPTPAQIDQAERELRAASDANIRSHGQLSAAVSRAQANLGRVQQAAVTGYGNYTIATAALVPQVPAPPPAPPIGPTPASKSKAADSGNDGPPADQKPRHTRAGDPVKPVDAGPGTDQISGGPTWPAGDVAPANVRPTASDPDPRVGPDPVTAPVAEALPAVVPTIVGTIVGSTGGALGGLAGAAPRMLGGLGSAAPAALSGLGNPVGEPPGGEPGGGEPQAPEAFGGMPQVPHVPDTGGTPNLDPPGGIGGGGSGGGIEPSGVAGPLAPAVGMVAVPDVAPVAAPVAAASPGAGAAEAGVGPGGMMMPPFFPPGRGQGSMSEADRKLYPQRRLKVIAPPNSEPVLRRREGRQITKEPEGGRRDR